MDRRAERVDQARPSNSPAVRQTAPRPDEWHPAATTPRQSAVQACWTASARRPRTCCRPCCARDKIAANDAQRLIRPGGIACVRCRRHRPRRPAARASDWTARHERDRRILLRVRPRTSDGRRAVRLRQRGRRAGHEQHASQHESIPGRHKTYLHACVRGRTARLAMLAVVIGAEALGTVSSVRVESNPFNAPFHEIQ